MKWLILYIIWFSFTYGFAQIINIPDTNFKNQLLLASTTYGIAYDCVNMDYYKIDANDDGEIQESEALAVCVLIVPTQNINDLTGIEKFTNLTGLNFGQNNIYTIDLSQLTHLQGLICTQNHLTNLDISTNTSLIGLACNSNQITSLDFTNNTQLLRVNCSNNLLTSLDFSNNPLFIDLGCKNNPNLTSIKIKNGVTQLLGSQSVYNQCWTGLPSLNHICADANEIDILESYLLACGIETSGITITSNCVLGVEEYGIDGVSIYPNPASSNVNITSKNSIKTIELIDVQGRILVSKVVNASEATLDIAGYGNGVYFIKVVGDRGSRIEKIIKE